ncbi:MAG: hypothetical protein MHMPM18_001888 [Marteilia pararefringens]
MVESSATIEAKLCRQLEFYFSNYNLAYDNFMESTMRANDGYVDCETFLKFNKVKQLVSDTESIVKAAELSQKLKLNDEKTKIGRIEPLPEDFKSYVNESIDRCVYLKGFALDSTAEGIREQIVAVLPSEDCIEGIFMRRQPADKAFKGSVYVTLRDMESVATLLAADLQLQEVRDGEKPEKMMKSEHLKQQKINNELKKDEKLLKQVPANSLLKFTNCRISPTEGGATTIDFIALRTALTQFYPCQFVEIFEPSEDQSKTPTESTDSTKVNGATKQDDDDQDESSKASAAKAVQLICRFRGDNSSDMFIKQYEKCLEAAKSGDAESLKQVDQLKSLLGFSSESTEQLCHSKLEKCEEIQYWKRAKEVMASKHATKTRNKKSRTNRPEVLSKAKAPKLSAEE